MPTIQVSLNIPGGEDLEPSTLNHIANQINHVFETVFQFSFSYFSVFWKDGGIPTLRENESAYIRQALERLPLNVVVRMIEDFTSGFLEERFIKLSVLPVLNSERNDADFLDSFGAFFLYFEFVCGIVGDHFSTVESTDLQRELGNRNVKKYFMYYGLRKLYSELVFRLRRATSLRLRTLRQGFPYTSKWIYRAFSVSPIAMVTQGFAKFLPTANFDEIKEDFKNSGVENAQELISSNTGYLPEKRFVVKWMSCLNVEKLMFKKLYLSPADEMREYIEHINNMFCHAHHDKVRTGILPDCKKTILNPTSHFDPGVFHDLTMMYVFLNSDFKEYFISDLGHNIREECKSRFRQYAPRHYVDSSVQWPLEYLRRSLEQILVLDTVVKERLSTVDELFARGELLQVYVIRASSELLCDDGDDHVNTVNIDEAQKCAIQYLCSEDDHSGNQDSRLSHIELFFRFLSNQGRFMEQLFEKMQSTFLSSKKANISRLVAFKDLPFVKDNVSSKVLNFIKDIQQSDRSHIDIQTKFGDNIGQTKFKASYIFKEKDWAALKDKENLLIQPEELMPIRDKAESYWNEAIGSGKEIRPVNALATVTIRTRMFTKNRSFTRINLLLYQALVLRLFQEKDSMLVSEMYNFLIRRDIPVGSSQRKTAEEVVNRLIHSMTEPYPLLLSVFDPDSPDATKRVYINQDFTFEEEDVALFGSNLLQENRDFAP